MSLSQAAASAAKDKKAAAKAASEEHRQQQLAQRRATLLEQWAPVATDENTTLIDERFEVTLMAEKHESGMFARPSWWEPKTITGHRFRVDDVDVFVWHGSRGAASAGFHATVIKPCMKGDCDNWAVVPSYGYPEDINTYSRQDDDKRREDLVRQIGEHLTHRTLCSEHHAEKINASCRTCGRPYYS